MSGQLQTLYVKEGDVVKKGNLLAIIDSKKHKMRSRIKKLIMN
ncbi:biotin/lipoyl-binding protein [Enterobacter hormaechei]